MSTMRELIENSAQGIEVLAVAIIILASVHGLGRYLLRIKAQAPDAYHQLKAQLGRALLLSLEFLVAADVIRTVALEPTLHNVMTLGLLVVIRTFLTWSLVVEMEGHWPWRTRSVEGGE